MQERTDPVYLAERARGGSMDALGALYDLYAPEVFRAASRLLDSRADAEDVVQDVFTALPRALRNYRGEGPLGAWIHRVGVRTALMLLRSRRRRREEPVESRAVDTTLAARGRPAVVDGIALQRALAQLPDTLRAVFVLKSAEGYSHDEIAELLDITAEASRARLARARTQLRNLLK